MYWVKYQWIGPRWNLNSPHYQGSVQSHSDTMLICVQLCHHQALMICLSVPWLPSPSLPSWRSESEQHVFRKLKLVWPDGPIQIPRPDGAASRCALFGVVFVIRSKPYREINFRPGRWFPFARSFWNVSPSRFYGPVPVESH